MHEREVRGRDDCGKRQGIDEWGDGGIGTKRQGNRYRQNSQMDTDNTADLGCMNLYSVLSICACTCVDMLRMCCN